LLFKALPDPAAAGQLAADGFYASYLIALVVSLVLVLFTRERSVSGAAVCLAVLLAFWLTPALRTHGDGWPFPLASLHASASIAHLLLALCMLALSWRFLKPARGAFS
jgi:hypothetical protein